MKELNEKDMMNVTGGNDFRKISDDNCGPQSQTVLNCLEKAGRSSEEILRQCIEACQNPSKGSGKGLYL